MSSGMNMAAAEEIAKRMTYRDAVNNALRGRCVPYKKATRIKLNELLDMLDKGLTVTEFADSCRECGAKYGKQKLILDKIKAEIDRQEKWLLQAGYTAYNVDIAFDAIKAVLAESEGKE